MKTNPEKNGFILIEILLAIFIFVLIFTGVSYLILENLNSSFERQERIKAEFLAKEGLEACRAIADNQWSDLKNGIYGLGINASLYQLADAPEKISSFLKQGQRQIKIEDQEDNLKKVTSLVTWQGLFNQPKQTFLITFLSNWQRTLGGGWDEPDIISYYALLSDARSVFHVGNYTYIGTLNYFGQPDFYIFDTSDLAKPILVSTLDLGAHTWATVNSIYVVGNYAFLATTINGREFVVVDISDPKNPIDVAYQTTQTLTDATGVHVSGDYAYVTNLYKKNQKQLYVFNVANPLDPYFVSRIDLIDSSYNLSYQDNFVFVASGLDDQELQIIDVTNPDSQYLYSSLDLPGTNDAYDIFVKKDKGYLVRANGADQPEFFILDLTDYKQPQIISSLELGDNFRTVYSFGENYMFVGGDLNQSQFIVIDISDINAPKVISRLDIKGIVYDLVTDDQAAYLAVGGGEAADNGLKIITASY